jgi:hypothetical protein
MSVKFNIGFQIDAETLFGIIAKFLPVENLSVEEVVERPQQPPMPKLPRTVMAALAHTETPKIKRRRQSLGANGGQLKVLADHARAHGVVTHAGLGDALKAAGFAKAGAGSAIKRALDSGILSRHGNNGYVVRE